MFWIENLPLVEDTEVILVAEDAAGNTNITSLSVVGSSVILTILSAPDGESLYSPSGVVYGTVSDPGYNSVRVNGVEADVDDYGFWYANDVPIYGSGTATFDVEASQEGGGTLMTVMGMTASGAGGGPVLASLQAEMPAHIEIVEHESSQSASYSFEGGGYANNSRTKSYRAEALSGPGGAWQAAFHGTATDFGENPNGWNRTVYEWTPTSRTTHWTDSTGLDATSGTIEESHQEVTSVPDKSLRELGWVGGSGGVGAYPPEWVHHYHARGVKYKWPDGYGGRITASVSARTQMKLYTGGKAGIKGRSLIHIEANAEQYGQPPNGPWLHTPKNNIDPTKIYVLGWWLFGRHALDPTGDLYLAMPDNAVKDLNLRVPGVKHYGAWASATRHKLVHETLHPALTDTNWARTKLGVGEQVNFRFEPTIPNLVWPDILWDTTHGGVETAGDGTIMDFTAPSNAANATVTVTVKGQTLKEKFKVVEPSGIATNTYKVYEYTFPPYAFGQGNSGAGMYLRVYLAPTDVSFYRVQCMEVAGNASSISGYFADQTRYPNPPIDLAHNPTRGANMWFEINPDNAWEYNGTGVRDWDRAWWGFHGQPWYPGGFTWIIPGAWRIQGGAAYTNMIWTQKFSMESNGTMKIEKFQQSVTRHPSSP